MCGTFEDPEKTQSTTRHHLCKSKLCDFVLEGHTVQLLQGVTDNSLSAHESPVEWRLGFNKFRILIYYIQFNITCC